MVRNEITIGFKTPERISTRWCYNVGHSAFLHSFQVEWSLVRCVCGEDEGAGVCDGFFYRQRPRVFLIVTSEPVEPRIESAYCKFYLLVANFSSFFSSISSSYLNLLFCIFRFWRNHDINIRGIRILVRGFLTRNCRISWKINKSLL